MASKKQGKRVKAVKRSVRRGVVHITATFKNTKITVTDLNGNTLCWASGGTVGYQNAKKKTSYAGQLAGEQAAQKAIKMGMREIEVRVKGAGSGRESAIRGLQVAGMQLRAIVDVTPLPHNGCRPRKKRRI
ncbi:MAG: 30S ribosomal protein S11 [Planctomycetota bacterium]